MSKAQHLNKDEELYLGTLVQNMVKAKEKLENSSNLTRQEKQKYSTDIFVGEEAVEKLVNANTGLVYAAARKFKSKYPSAPNLEDLVQDGMAGLLTAIMRYDPSRNNKLSTVATPWIFQSITRWTNTTGRLVRLPESQITNYIEISKLRTKYQEEGLSHIDADERIMEELQISRDTFFKTTSAALVHASLNRKVDNDSEKELLEIVLDDVSDSAESLVVADATFQILVDKIQELSEIEREVVVAQFSLDQIPGVEMMKPKDLKEKYDLSAARYKRILRNALAIINKDMKELDLSFNDFINE